MLNRVSATPYAWPRFGQAAPSPATRIAELKQRYPVYNTFFDLVAIATPTPQKDPQFAPVVATQMAAIQKVILDRFRALGVTDITEEPNGSVIIRLPGSPGYENARPLLLTAHMDMVAGDPADPGKPVKPTIIHKDGKEFVASDGTTTLGADDKGGIAMILDVVARLQGKHPGQPTPMPHAPLEILLSPDEESSCNSLKTLDTSKLKARHVLVVDEFKLYQVTTGLASAVLVDIQAQGIQGGHSGDDIHKRDRINALGLMSELNGKLRTGVVAWHPRIPNMPLISKNLGLMNGGSAYNAIPESAHVGYMLRSFDAKAQEKELARMRRAVRRIEQKYQKLQPNLRLTMTAVEEYPAWEADPKSPIPNWAREAAKQLPENPFVKVGPTHAAAQASILAVKKNAFGEPFDAALIGPNIEEAHTVRERMEVSSLVNGARWLGHIIQAYSRAQKAAS